VLAVRRAGLAASLRTGSRPFPQDPTVCLVVYPVHAVPIQVTGCTDAYELHNDWSMFHP
jgi:hypothetical protein